MAFLDLKDIYKTYEGAPLLRGVSFAMQRGEIVCLLGPSGSGKTTLLRIVAGLEMAERGEVKLEGQRLAGVPAHRRGIVLMFQDYALFPHRSVAENIAFGLRMQGASSQAREARVEEMLTLVGLDGFGHRDVNELSGGERQRVALARSLAPQPRLLLLDEPLGALDRTLRERLLEELPVILQRVGMTTLTVTHDQEEAFALADRVVLLREGQVTQMGTPQAVYDAPANTWVARFLGLNNLYPATVMAQQSPCVRTVFGDVALPSSSVLPAAGTQGTLLVHPWGVVLTRGRVGAKARGEETRTGRGPSSEPTSLARDDNPVLRRGLSSTPSEEDSVLPPVSEVASDGVRFEGRVTRRVFHGRIYEITLTLPGECLLHITREPGGWLPAEGETVQGWVAPQACRWLQGAEIQTQS